MMISCFWILVSHNDQLLEMNHKMEVHIEQGSNQFAASQQVGADLMQSGPGGVMPTWIVAAGFLMFGAGLTWLAAITCALIAVRDPANRNKAYVAIGLCAMMLIPFGLSFFFS